MEYSGETWKTLENNLYKGVYSSKISFFDLVNFRENRKATPPGTLSFPPKICRLVWPYAKRK